MHPAVSAPAALCRCKRPFRTTQFFPNRGACRAYVGRAGERGSLPTTPVHDAVLICAPLDQLDADVARMQDAMREASRIVLNGFELGTDATVVRHPDRYMDERGTVMWKRVMTLMDLVESGHEGVVALTTQCCSADNTPAVTPNSATQCQ